MNKNYSNLNEEVVVRGGNAIQFSLILKFFK